MYSHPSSAVSHKTIKKMEQGGASSEEVEFAKKT